MEDEFLKINIFSITVSGLLMLISGIILFYCRTRLATGGIRYFLPIPPIGVAAYIFVFNMFKHYGGSLPKRPVSLMSEIAISTAVSGLIFFAFVVFLVIIIGFFIK